MVFSSLTFLIIFMLATLALYFAVPFKAKNIVLLICSLVFYAWGEPIYIVLILYSIVFNYLFGRLMDSFEGGKRRFALVFAIIMNLAILFYFKYAAFAVHTFNRIAHTSFSVRELALPIGVSFYTFQALSYIIDLYRKKFQAQKNFFNFSLYIIMFPQLIAGPIVRYESIEAQLTNREISLEKFGQGSVRFLYGLAKKVLIANAMGAVFDSVHGLNGNVAVTTAWMGAIAYTFQIYFDFSGYSDMAIGLGKMLGFDYCENFDHPYVAGSVTDFWHRWHISLSTWFKEYVYIPLGGNKKGPVRHIINMLIVWLLTGLWHGAAWNFVLWGVYYGVLLCIEKYGILRIKKLPKWILHIYTGVAVIIGWVIFSSDSLQNVWTILQSMFYGTLWDAGALYLLRTNWPMLVLAGLFSTSLPLLCNQKLLTKVPGRVLMLLWNIGLLFLCILTLVTENYNPFLYFQF